ncbi:MULTISPECIES: aspartyl-phosphate phosphatase Spo0E family protein [Bacillales]|uniref:aspartyl-phosphate phosphatase Spo0E family protein n=1 Tax=Bacillales TaxID=1385 RepID=UPI0018831D0A|nr:MULTISPECIES: aspartyl-phosphate phosphatase Spo0E family protein [Bacillaceae]MBF0708111.1 aspartyl-phosphate phosphatase Spo0E family protein [Pseudalkalibacillus hwajinpoensis]MDO6658608.1 aspartyl-phosphate phosphatase Spo0E family protein [Anaerobacillus sp. 1_MG-2023]WLR59438.1 aspartyl-phosphate phosphatase Spo0E family protein [Pseudalkalibacillus hwajinpoensis]
MYDAIEKKRKEMFEVAGRYGFASERTIRCSQELDRLLNALMQMNHQNEEVL